MSVFHSLNLVHVSMLNSEWLRGEGVEGADHAVSSQWLGGVVDGQ